MPTNRGPFSPIRAAESGYQGASLDFSQRIGASGSRI
jgi:hypothetical protein